MGSRPQRRAFPRPYSAAMKGRWWFPVVAAAQLISCAADRQGPAEPPRTAAIVPTPDEVFSEPVEYRAQPPSAAAGDAFFNRLGVGDPYGAGIPYPIFAGLQALYPDELGADWHGFSERFGTITNVEAPDDPLALPVGFHQTTDPETRVDFVVANCQLCHAEVLQIAGEPQLVPGLGNKRLRLHAYDAALVRIADDPALDDTTLLQAARKAAAERGLHWPPDFRKPIVAAALAKLRRRANVRRADADRLAAGLPGRLATVEGFMLAMNESGTAALDLPDALGWAKIPDIAPWRYRETNSFDGVATGDPVATVAEADFAFGVRPQWYLTHPHIATSIYLYLRSFSRELPFPGDVDETLAAAGAIAFSKHCADCHGTYDGPFVGYEESIVPHAVVGTDRVRLDAVTDAFVAAAERVESTRGLVVTARSVGYVPRPLVDVWARGVYGHAGQWPDLATLAMAPEERPRNFVVDTGAPLNLERVGVAWTAVPEGAPAPADRSHYRYEGDAPGYGVEGHPFLSDRPAAEQRAILEYLKTL